VLEISQRLARRVRVDFIDDAELVLAVLQGLDLLLMDTRDRAGVERVLAAVVLPARGDLDRLGELAELATTDWRDALVGAGLANADWPERLDAELEVAG
jgi:hypothetical protein